LRIGLASEAFPISIPHVIARKLSAAAATNSANDSMDVDHPKLNQEEYDYALEEIRGELRWRMKNAKRRAVPNAESQVVGFNAAAVKETILDHNDPYKVEWTEVNKDIPYFVGEKALNVPVTKNSLYSVRYPWKNGTINNQDYPSVNAVLSDLEAIWTEAIVNDLQVERSEFKNCNAVLVIPDKLDHGYLCDLVTMMLRYMKFKAVIIQQESTAATYGAGVSSAVVVDIGAQKTNIVCIEDGVCQLESRISISLGGDDITKTFASFLLKNKFPYADIDLSTAYDWRLAETLKERWCTMNEADISVQVYDFYARTPFKPTLKYQCKVYDEVFLAPLCLVYPAILEPKSKRVNWVNKNVTDDVIEDCNTASSNNGNSKNQEYDSFPIDVAIAQSIMSAANGSEEKLKRYFTSIILVGGGGKVVNFSRVLEDRVLSTIIAQKANIDRVEVVPAPRELDPEVLVWKGASVMAKLDSAKDMWIADEEWEQAGARCLRERAMLMHTKHTMSANSATSSSDKRLSTISNDDTREKMLYKRQQLLQTYYDSLQNQVKQSERDLAQATQQRQNCEMELEKAKKRNEELKAKLKDTQNTLYETTKPIRVTDDDFSTIIATLGKFSGKVTNFSPNAKSAFRYMRDPEQTKLFFCGLFEEDTTHIAALFDKASNPDNKTDYMLVSVLVERYLTEKIATSVLKAGIHLDQATNESFGRLQGLFVSCEHEGWAKDLRLKTAKATADLIQRKDPQTLATIEQTKAAIAKEIEIALNPIYDMTPDVVDRIKKLIDMASDLCLPIN
ncbi:hypothetical protein, partial, partial [Parasitella parasitica]